MTELPEPDAPPPPPPGARTNPFDGLRRSSADRWIAGVASGIARHFGIDVRLVRLVAVGLGIAGIGVPAYLVAWLLLPADDGVSVIEANGWSRNTVIVVSALVVFAGFAVTMGDHPGQVIALVIVAVCVWLIVRPQAPVLSASPTMPMAPPVAPPPNQAAPDPAAAAPVVARRPMRARPFLTPLALAASAVVVGVALMVGPARWTQPAVVWSIVLGVIGVTLVVSAFIGRARGLIAIGVLVAVPLMIGTVVDGRWGDWRPTWSSTPVSTDRLDGTIERGFGQSRIDLSRVPFPSTKSTAVRFEQIAGDVTIVLPADATVEITATVEAGQLVVDPSGPATSVDGTRNRVHRTVVTGDGSARVSLEAHLWAGRLEIVERATGSTTPTPTVPVRPGAPR